MRKVVRWAARIALGGLALAIVAAAGLLLAIHTDWGRERIRRVVQANLQATFVGGARVGKIEGSPLTELVLRGLVIDGPDGRPAIEVGTLRIHVAILPLLSHEVRVERLIADDVDVALEVDPRGGPQITHLLKPGPASTWNVALPHVELHRGHVAYDTGTQRIDVDGIQLDAHATLPHDGPIEVAAAIGATWRQRAAALTATGVLHADATHLVVPAAFVRLGGIEAAALGLAIPGGDGGAAAGAVAISAPAAAVAGLVPGLELPDDVAMVVAAGSAGAVMQVSLVGVLGRAPVRGFARADVRAATVTGAVTATDLDLGRLSTGRLRGAGGVFAAFDVAQGRSGELPAARAMVTAWTDLGVSSVLALATDGERIRATIGAATTSGLRAAAGAEVRLGAKSTILERAVVIASTRDPARVTGAPLHGRLSALVTGHGVLAPAPDLTITGHVDGARLRFADVAAEALHLRIDAAQLPAHPVGSAHLELVDAVRGTTRLGTLRLAAENRRDGKVAVSLRAAPARWQVDVDALVTPGRTIAVELQRNLVRTASGAIWRGTTGVVTVGPERVEVRGVRSTSATGTLGLDGSYGRSTGDLAAKLDARLDLRDVSATARGVVDGAVELERRAGRWAGTLVARASGLAADPAQPAFDGTATVVARGGALTADVRAASARVGAASVTLELDAPRDLTDLAAWRRLPRSAIHDARLVLERVELGAVGQLAKIPLEGSLAGELELAADRAGGALHLTGVRAGPMGRLDAELRLSQPSRDELATALSATLGKARVTGEVRVTVPDRLFDPKAWTLGALRVARVGIHALRFEPEALARLGVASPLRGTLELDAALEAGGRRAAIGFDVADLRGGVLAQPVAVHVDTAIDATSLRGALAVRAPRVTLVQLTTELPITLDRLRTDPRAVLAAPLHATGTIRSVPVQTMLGVLGSTAVAGGRLDGTLVLAGTLARLTAKLSLVARDLTVPSEGYRPQAVKRLTLDGSWDGSAGKLAIVGEETSGGRLRIDASARAGALRDVTAELEATRLDIAPLVAFLPGAAGALAGVLDAKLAVRGTEPRTGELDGTLHLTNGRIPIDSDVGTLFHADVRVGIANHVAAVQLSGKLGNGDVHGTASAQLEGVLPTTAKAELRLRRVQLIGTIQPIVDGSLTAELARVEDRWQARVKVASANVTVPDNQGEDLDPVGAPSDLVFGSEADLAKRPRPTGGGSRRRPPERPVLTAAIEIAGARVQTKEVHGTVSGKLEVTLGGAELGMTGELGLESGDLALFGRRYVVDRARVHFDGSLDPVLDIRITHDFTAVTTITEVRGRLSKPDLTLSSVPSQYTQAQLLGFLIGGEPETDPSLGPSATSRVTQAGATILANKLGGMLKQALPVDIDVLRYESASATSSAAVTVGTWLTHQLFVAYRHHLEARPDANTGEGEVEYWLARRLVLSGFLGDRGYDGLDLLWRRRW